MKANSVHVTYADNQIYPEGIGTFGKMTLKHFSPYAIFDSLTDKEKEKFEGVNGKLTEEERAVFEKIFGNLMNDEKGVSYKELTEIIDVKQEEKDSELSMEKTGDSLKYLTVSGFLLMALAVLVVTFNSRRKKKKY